MSSAESLELLKDIEIYVKYLDHKALERWLEERLGGRLVQRGSDQPDMGYYSIDRGEYDVAVTVTQGCEFPPRPGQYTSVYFLGTVLPWNNDVECARDAARALESEVVCSPESIGHTAPDEWLMISSQDEFIFLSS